MFTVSFNDIHKRVIALVVSAIVFFTEGRQGYAFINPLFKIVKRFVLHFMMESSSFLLC
jgi:hypothetical protein